MSRFLLHQTLSAGTLTVTSWDLCRVLLMNDSRYQWIILVPALPGIEEIHDLDVRSQSQLILEIDRASRALSNLIKPDKINIGALGNLVSQLHIHIIARFIDDDAWPGPVWGAHLPIPYDPLVRNSVLQKIKRALC